MKRKITWVEDSASVAKLSAGFSLFFFTYPGTIIALQMKKCRIARHNLTNICSQTLLSFCGVFAGGGIVSLLDYNQRYYQAILRWEVKQKSATIQQRSSEILHIYHPKWITGVTSKIYCTKRISATAKEENALDSVKPLSFMIRHIQQGHVCEMVN